MSEPTFSDVSEVGLSPESDWDDDDTQMRLLIFQVSVSLDLLRHAVMTKDPLSPRFVTAYICEQTGMSPDRLTQVLAEASEKIDNYPEVAEFIDGYCDKVDNLVATVATSLNLEPDTLLESLSVLGQKREAEIDELERLFGS